jgi:2,4-dienoyl-CoA reductase-like NADH-dependent reductase (Old Yellow Enzyme family)
MVLSRLFEPVALGELSLPNRIVMAPMTRCRAGEERIPNALMASYYAQRASAGLIITEATVVSAQGIGYSGTPGIWSEAQVAGWRLVTAAVHAAGGRIALQLWHVGRISHPLFQNGALPVAPSAIAPQGNVSQLKPPTPFVVPRALETQELAGIVETFRAGAQNAQRAGFDGVELHGANGYLLDQFLQDSSNQRTDQYGGPIENRARLLLEATDAAISVWGPGRVGVHLAPRSDAHSMGDSDPAATFGYVARELGRRRIAFICARNHAGDGDLGLQIKAQFGGAYIANEGYTPEAAEQAIAAGSADAVAFAKLFIANPDLPRRIREGAKFNELDAKTMYGEGPAGYTDYPNLS